jgi:hypothetical protein
MPDGAGGFLIFEHSAIIASVEAAAARCGPSCVRSVTERTAASALCSPASLGRSLQPSLDGYGSRLVTGTHEETAREHCTKVAHVEPVAAGFTEAPSHGLRFASRVFHTQNTAGFIIRS